MSKPNIVKVTSEAEASATPRTIGINEAYNEGWKTSPSMNADAMALTTGSSALTTCVKETDNDKMTMTMTLREVQHLSMEAWPYRQECRGHDPAKTNLLR